MLLPHHTQPLDEAQSRASACFGQEQAVWLAAGGLGRALHLRGLRRGSLSAFHCSYQLTSYSYDLEMPVWDEFVAELQCIRSLLSLGISPWQDQWNEFVYQSGACLTGYGVRCAHWLRERVE